MMHHLIHPMVPSGLMFVTFRQAFYRKCLFIHIEYEWMKVDCFNKTFLRFSDRFTGFCWKQSSSAGL